MKRIIKDPEPQDYSAWNETDHMAHRPRWKRVPTSIKKKVHQSLMREQGFICCYCETFVAEEDSHVEHFRPKRCEVFQLDYANLLCSCQGETPPGEPHHCGASKRNWFDEELLISPLSPDCEDRFRFTAYGEILPRQDNDVGAKETIRRLRLDLPKLRSRREAAVNALYESSANEIKHLLVRNAEGRFLQYYSTIRQVLSI